MSETIKQGPPDEQVICVGCGFCCDGTLFLHAHLEPGERGSGELPEWIEQNSIVEEGKDYFKLPCGYFSEKCTIYDRQRADVCSSFRCQLLKDFAGEMISGESAVLTVREAKVMRDSVLEEYRRITGKETGLGFRRVLAAMVKLIGSSVAGGSDVNEKEVLLARCNILEALLIKKFMAAGEFEKYLMK